MKNTTEYTTLKQKISDIFYALKDSTSLSEFYRKSEVKDLYSTVQSFITSLNNLAFGQLRRRASKKVLEKMKTIIFEFENFQITHSLQI